MIKPIREKSPYLILSSWFVFVLCLFFTGCASRLVRFKTINEVNFTKVNFPKTISLLDTEENFSNDLVTKYIQSIKETGLDSDRRFILRDLYLKGLDLKERDKANQAAFIFKILLHFYPNDFLINRDLIVSLIRSASFEEAEKFLKISISRNFPQKTSFMLILAGLYSATGRDVDSVSAYENVLSLDGSNEEACIFLAKNLSSTGKPKKAIKTLKKCISWNSKNPIFYYYIGKIHLVENQKEKSDYYFKKALRVNPNYYQAALGRGLLKEESENYKAAAKIYEDFLKIDGENLIILNRLVQTLFVLEKFDTIIPYLEELIRQDSSNINLKVKLGILYTEKKEYKKAISLFEKVLKVAPKSDKILYYLGALYQQVEKFEKAIVFYSRIENNSDLYFDSNLQISKLLRGLVSSVSQDKYFKIIEEVRAKFKSSKADAAKAISESLIFSEAFFYGHHKRFADAISAMSGIEKMDISQKYFLANLYDKVKKYKEAITLMMGVIKENPKNAHALNFVGYLILENESDFDKAYGLIKKAIEIEPNDAYIRDSLGWYFFKIGDFSKALVELKKAWNSQKSDVIITKHLALVYQKLNNDIEAEKYFVEALKNCKEKSQREEILNVMEKRIIERLPASVTGD